ncbi:MAG: GntR family transcriptional regulator [Thermodesulfobacteriota bacterium]|jgi:GntR family transcriptional regulator
MKLKKTPVPLYYQLEKVLRKRILSGKLKTDQAVPTEKELCQEFGVSRITVRQALLSLESDDLIRREQGRGTFVSFRKENPIQFRLYGMVEDLFQMGAQTLLKLHSKKLINPAPEIVKDMKLSPREKVYLFEGIRHLVNEHKAFFRAYVPEEIGKNIKLSDPDSPLLIERVEREILERVKRGRQIISASMADHHLAEIMGVKKGTSLLVVKRIYFSRSGRALEMAVTHFPGDVHQGVAELVRVTA